MLKHRCSYDAEDRLLSVDGSAATYGYFGAVRVGKTVGASTTRYIFSGSRAIAKYVNGALAEEYIYAGGQMLARVQADGTATYRHMDHLSVRAETDAAGNKVHEYGLLPFGDTWYDSGSGPATEWLFTSFQRDTESGLDYSIFRYYSSRLARWTTADPAGMAAADATAPQSWNRYGYVLNDPVNFVDPFGLCEQWTYRQDPVTGNITAVCADPTPSDSGSTPPNYGQGGSFTWTPPYGGCNTQLIEGWEITTCPKMMFLDAAVDVGGPPNKAANNCTPGTPGCFNVPTQQQLYEQKYNQWKSCNASAKSKRNRQLVGSIGTSVLSSFALTAYAFVLITNPELATLETLPHTAVPLAAPAVTYVQSIQATTNILNEYDQNIAACNAAAGYAFN